METKPKQKPDDQAGARAYLPAEPDADIDALRTAAQGCRGCDLYRKATQAVFGRGSEQARMMLIGEQPGDKEDLAGEPFVGPAGKLLDKALLAVPIDPAIVYTTNAVKHFKWVAQPKSKRRLHVKPSAREVSACRPWLEREIERVKPSVIVCLGATAGQALFGSSFRVGAMRGKEITGTPWAPCVIATIHPSALLRMPDREMMEQEFEALVADLRLARAALPKSR